MSDTHTIPNDFDYQLYLKYNPDLIQHGITTEEQAVLHYLTHGRAEKRSYKNHNLIEDIDSNFDPIFYLNEYPETQTYFHSVPNISQKQKLYHHYINYGRHEGRFRNGIEKYKSFIDTSHSILNNISSNDLCYINNKLESICLLVTEQEILNKSYRVFIDQLIFNTKNLKEYQSIDFNIITNNLSKTNIKQIHNNRLNKIFKNIQIINLELNEDEDCYIKKRNDNIAIPKYGLKSGPNIAFFKTIKLCKKYNTTLLLETDCILSPNWLTKLINYTKSANGFLVSGAMYDGKVFAKTSSQMKTHINGGTALYATGSNILQELIELLARLMEKQIAHNIPGLAYDYALKLLIDTNFDNSFNKPQETDIWQFIHRNYLHCKAIINCSSPLDAGMNVEELYNKYQYAILHKKS